MPRIHSDPGHRSINKERWSQLFSASTVSVTPLILEGQQLRAPALPPVDSPATAMLPTAALVACLATVVGLLRSVLFSRSTVFSDA